MELADIVNMLNVRDTRENRDMICWLIMQDKEKIMQLFDIVDSQDLRTKYFAERMWLMDDRTITALLKDTAKNMGRISLVKDISIEINIEYATVHHQYHHLDLKYTYSMYHKDNFCGEFIPASVKVSLPKGQHDFANIHGVLKNQISMFLQNARMHVSNKMLYDPLQVALFIRQMENTHKAFTTLNQPYPMYIYTTIAAAIHGYCNNVSHDTVLDNHISVLLDEYKKYVKPNDRFYIEDDYTVIILRTALLLKRTQYGYVVRHTYNLEEVTIYDNAKRIHNQARARKGLSPI